MGRIAQYALIALALLGTFAGAKLSLSHLHTGETCPMLGPIAACYVVAAGYLAVALSAIFARAPWSMATFLIGWSPIFLLALSGVILELTGTDICPSGAMGIPQCFYSLAMALICGLLFLTFRRSINQYAL